MAVSGSAFKMRFGILSGPGAVFLHLLSLSLMSSGSMGRSSGWSWSAVRTSYGVKRSEWVVKKVSIVFSAMASKSGLTGWLWMVWRESRKAAAFSSSLTRRRSPDWRGVSALGGLCRRLTCFQNLGVSL